ncbi:hypothetical protein Psch_03449 [Pelotomaculum schinkii]|uniref:Uncharacterized protein n=1 Tax=Pelotomaculum schinkii TaxID=78350 RepID=A0A4Y7R769_9FIRM|nr:hypothetical protein [Pelotomaculum schinkii]TEB04687.1 hypothetical protein Psch_03449 [Pelotomaculum schinkii]
MFADKRAIAGVFLTTLIIISGCSGQTGNTLPPGGGQPLTEPAAVAPHGIDTDSPTSADRVTLNCFVDADRGNDFIVHGTFHLPGTAPEGQNVNPERFQVVIPATETVREAIRASVGQTVSLFGKFDSIYGTGQGLFSPVSLEASAQAVPQAPSWIGWGLIDNTQAGHFFECREGAALTDWVTNLSDLANALDLPTDENISDFLSRAEKNGGLAALKYKTNQVLLARPLVYDGDKALADIRAGSGQFGFVTSAKNLQNMLVHHADVRESDVKRFMSEAKGIWGEGDGPHKQAPATIFGIAEKNNTGIYVKGVQGDSFSEWMDIFRGKSLGYPVKWEALELPEQCLNSGNPVYCWFSGTRVQDPTTKQWYFSVGTVLTEERYDATMTTLSALLEK